MQNLISVIETFLPGGVRADSAGSASADEAASIDEFNDRLIADGQWVFAAGLTSPSEAVLIEARGDANASEQAPLFDSAEHYGGFWIVEAPNRDAALALAAAGSQACNRRVEVRALMGPPD